VQNKTHEHNFTWHLSLDHLTTHTLQCISITEKFQQLYPMVTECCRFYVPVIQCSLTTNTTYVSDKFRQPLFYTIHSPVCFSSNWTCYTGNVFAVPVYLCCFMHHWIWHLASALFYRKINLNTTDVYTQNTFQYM
jgi:hypothetical protein